mmetsp:Transcript_5621/g.16324  ORF Transcript_5621/g.16324 Transcript_5621/m.16324 type:complete len:362 (-) Transcript_5621:138-1223(-)
MHSVKRRQVGTKARHGVSPWRGARACCLWGAGQPLAPLGLVERDRLGPRRGLARPGRLRGAPARAAARASKGGGGSRTERRAGRRLEGVPRVAERVAPGRREERRLGGRRLCCGAVLAGRGGWRGWGGRGGRARAASFELLGDVLPKVHVRGVHREPEAHVVRVDPLDGLPHEGGERAGSAEVEHLREGLLGEEADEEVPDGEARVGRVLWLELAVDLEQRDVDPVLLLAGLGLPLVAHEEVLDEELDLAQRDAPHVQQVRQRGEHRLHARGVAKPQRRLGRVHRQLLERRLPVRGRRLRSMRVPPREAQVDLAALAEAAPRLIREHEPAGRDAVAPHVQARVLAVVRVEHQPLERRHPLS